MMAASSLPNIQNPEALQAAFLPLCPVRGVETSGVSEFQSQNRVISQLGDRDPGDL